MVRNDNKTANVNARNLHISLTTVAQTDTSKTANIIDTNFSRKSDNSIAAIDVNVK